MESLALPLLTTIAGSGKSACIDGVGTSAAFHSPHSLAYFETSGVLLIAESGSNRIRRLFPAAEATRTGIKSALDSMLIQSGALSVQQLVSIIFDYAIGNSMCTALALAVALLFTHCDDAARFDWIVQPRAFCVTDEVVTICCPPGAPELSAQHGRGGGKLERRIIEAKFDRSIALCIDPFVPSNFYVGDASAIRYINTEAGTISLIAGSDDAVGSREGTGSEARFNGIGGMIATSDVRVRDRIKKPKLYITDTNNNRIRCVDVKSRAVITLVGSNRGNQFHINGARRIVFDRYTPRIKPAVNELLAFVTVPNAITRIDLGTRQASPLPFDPGSLPGSGTIDPDAIDCLSTTGHLIVGCRLTKSIYIVDPVTKAVFAPIRRVDGSLNGRDRALLSFPFDLVAAESERCVYLIDHSDNRVRHMTLPAHLFVR